MSIQFLCVSCRKPIEVDDQWAMKVVECPYCHGQVTAPGASTYQGDQPIVAREVSSGSLPEYAPPTALGAQPAQRSNVVAVVALLLVLLSLGMFVGSISMMVGKMLPVVEQGGSAAEQEAALKKLLTEAAERQESWVITSGLVTLGGMVLWGVGVVCGLIGVTRPARRGFAIAALVLAVMPLGLILLGALFQ